MTVPLTAHHLRFTVTAETAITFHDFKGSALRGAIAGYLRRNYCPEWRAEKTDPLHQALCPVCQLLSFETTPEEGGDIRRPFALQPPQTTQNHFAPGESFNFGLTLFGNQLAYLPYLVLAVRAMGEEGVGVAGEDRRRGRFRLERIDAVNPLTGETKAMLAPGAAMVQTATLPVTHEQVLATANALAQRLPEQGNLLTIEFMTPLRLIQSEHTVKTPAFFPLAKQVVLRVLDLCAQHGDSIANSTEISAKSVLHDFASREVLKMRIEKRSWLETHYIGSGQKITPAPEPLQAQETATQVILIEARLAQKGRKQKTILQREGKT